MPSASALILFAHGARDPEWAAPLRRVQAAVQAAQPTATVDLAFLEFMTPDLTACVAGLAERGIRRIAVVPMFIAQGGHLKRELPEMLTLLRSTHPQIEFSLSGPIGEDDQVIAAMARAAAERAGLPFA